jgi:hypothetical protein
MEKAIWLRKPILCFGHQKRETNGLSKSSMVEALLRARRARAGKLSAQQIYLCSIPELSYFGG